MGVVQRRKRESDGRRGSILEAARAVFAERAAGATTMRDIAARAELALGTLYLYFGSKDEIHAALLQEALAHLDRSFAAAATGRRSPRAALRDLLQGYYRFFRAHPKYFRLLLDLDRRAPGVLPAPLQADVDRRARLQLARIEAVLKRGIAAGTFRRVDPAVYACLLWGTANGVLQLLERGKTSLAGVDGEKLLAASLEFLLRGLENPSPRVKRC